MIPKPDRPYRHLIASAPRTKSSTDHTAYQEVAYITQSSAMATPAMAHCAESVPILRETGLLHEFTVRRIPN